MITDSDTEAKPNAGRALIAQACAATLTAQNHMDRARAALNEAEHINQLGVLVDRASTLAQLGAAKRAITEAMAAIANAPWPEQRTYEEAAV